MIALLVSASMLTAYASAALAGDSVVVTIIDGRKAKADITLINPNGGHYTAEFELEFEAAGLQNLTAQCLNITADVLDAGEIAQLTPHLPHSTHQHIPLEFPVRVTVEPPAACGLTFQNHYDVTFETEDLVYSPGGPYRLVKAPIGGDFHYVTGSVTQGSVRSRGRTGAFSEFLIIADDDPTYSIDCEKEYNDLQTRIDASTMSPTARQALTVDIAISRAAYEARNYADAIARLAIFDQHCVEYGGASLPNVWRSERDLDNVEGDLVGNTDSLRFMMGRLSGQP
ncbi:MAG TPA: DUF6689 family protein [Casimicrobiaceae bacterium]|nr:DUF6689 family protein [Casimicrobiaceae bacterium]